MLRAVEKYRQARVGWHKATAKCSLLPPGPPILTLAWGPLARARGLSFGALHSETRRNPY
jgi:hypothetical protein